MNSDQSPQFMSKTWKILPSLGSGLAQALFTLVPWLMASALGYILVRELAKDTHDSALLATLVVLLLIVILFGRYENELVGRIKKIGPLELFEEARDIFSGIEEISTKLPLVGQGLISHPMPSKLSSQEIFFYQEGDKAISLLEFTKSHPEKTKDRDRYFDLLAKVGRCAFMQNDWARATYRLDKLRELSGDSYKPEFVLPLVGLSYFYWALEEEGPERRTRFERAIESFSKLIKSGRTDHLVYFFLAYAQDEIGQYSEAIESNKEALKRRPYFAPAKYNTAVSYLKLRDFQSAYDSLTKITEKDEKGTESLESALIDDELKPLREHESWGSKIALFLQEGNKKD